MFWTILFVGLIILLIVCIVTLYKGIKVLVWNFKSFFGQMKRIEEQEKAEADSIMYEHVKDGKIPSWAYEEAKDKIKSLSNRTEYLTFHDYMSKVNLEVIELPVFFRFTEQPMPRELTDACIIRIRDFDLETYVRDRKLQPQDQETMDYLVRMWFFSDPFCSSMIEAEDHVYGCLDSMVADSNPNSRRRYARHNNVD